jgi:predicted nucleotidyltransferase
MVQAEMALHCGADLIIELPFCFSVRSAFYFAPWCPAIDLNRTGVVTHLPLALNTGNLPASFKSIASIISSDRKLTTPYLKESIFRT